MAGLLRRARPLCLLAVVARAAPFSRSPLGSGARVGLRCLSATAPEDMDALRAISDGEALEAARLALASRVGAAETAAADGDAAERAALPSLRLMLAFAHIRLGDVMAAAPLVDDVLALEAEESEGDGVRSEAHFLAGVVRARSGEEEEAIDAFERALELDPEAWRPRFQLALLAVRWDMLDDARQLLGEVLELNADHQTSRQILDKLDELAEARAADEAEAAAREAEAAAARSALEADASLPSEADILEEVDGEEDLSSELGLRGDDPGRP